MKSIGLSIAWLLVLSGCGARIATQEPGSDTPPGGVLSEPRPEEDHPAAGGELTASPEFGQPVTVRGQPRGAFTAEYYNGTKLVATETVAQPAINYAWSDFHGIPSENFRAVWEGTLEITRENSELDINSDAGWSSQKLFIDGAPVPFAEHVHRSLSEGPHKIRVEFENRWHTTRFHMSFTTHEVLSEAQAKVELSPLLTGDTKIVHLDIYEPSPLHNDVTVTLRDPKRPVFIFVSAYHAAHWKIANPENVEIRGVAYGAYAPGTTMAAPEGVPTFAVDGLAHGGQVPVSRLAGRAADSTKEEYGFVSTVVSAR